MPISEKVRDVLEQKFGPDIISEEQNTGLQPVLVIDPDNIRKVCTELRDNSDLCFDFLACLTGVDYGTDQNRFGVVYHISSIPFKEQISLKVIREFDRSEGGLPVFPSVSDIWKTADWHEREAFDLVGISFDGHPDLRRILLPDDWDGHPLRKDYVTAEEYHGIKIN